MDDKKWKRQVMLFYGKTTGWILAPLLLALFLGKMITKETASNIGLFVCLIVGFLITIYGIYREIKVYNKNLDGDK